MAQHMGDDISQGAQKTYDHAKSAVKSVKAAQKAAAQLATGNAVGAAISVAKDSNFRKIIAAILLLHIFIIFCVFFLIPMSLYEGISSYFSGIAEAWKADYFSGEGPSLSNFLHATGNAIGSMAQDAWSAIKSWFPHGNSEDAGNQDASDSDDLMIIGNEEKLKTVYNRKIDACIQKLNARAESVKENILNNQGTIAGVLNDHFYSNCFPQISAEIDNLNDSEYQDKYGFKAKEYKMVYDGANINVNIRPSTKRNPKIERTALNLLSLYSTQFNIQNLDDLQISDLLKWLGYNGNSSHGNIEYPLGDNEGIVLSVPAWKGTFVPQYLIEEAMQKERNEKRESQMVSNKDNMSDSETTDISDSKYLKSYIEEYGCAVSDLMIKVNCPNLYSLSPSRSEEIHTKHNTVRVPVTLGYDWSKLRKDDFKPYYDRNGWHYNKTYWYVMNDEVFRKSTAYYLPYLRGYETVDADIPETEIITYHYSFTVSISVGIRDVKDIVEIAGLWDDWLELYHVA